MASEGGPLWVDGEIVLRLDGGAPVRIGRPYAVIGRTEGADLRVPERDASARHVYLHLDARGVFAVDLATRTGTRFADDPEPAPTAWLESGAAFEVAGRRIELLAARVAGRPLPGPPPGRPRSLIDAADALLPGLALGPLPSASGPWTVSSELVFLGRSMACGVPAHGAGAAKVHAVIARTRARPYLVNLIGAGLWLDGRPVRSAAALARGAVLTIGTSRFEVQLERAPAGPEIPSLEVPAVAPEAPGPATLPARLGPQAAPQESAPWPTELVLPEGVPPPPPELFQADGQAAALAWMMGVVQATQAEMMRRQHDFQMELIRALRGLHEDNQAVLKQHQARVEAIHDELAALRDDIRNRFGGAAPAVVVPARPKGPPIQLPKVDSAPSDPATATAWLLDRVNRLDEANRATWKDLLGRLGGKA